MLDDIDGPDRLKQLVLIALKEAEECNETLVACFLAQALDTIQRRPSVVAVG